MLTAVKVYVVKLQGEAIVKADTDDEAKRLALAYFAQAPMNYLSIEGTKDVQVEVSTP